jgi:hypothetical protein
VSPYSQRTKLTKASGSEWSDRLGAICFSGPQHKVEDLKDVFDAPDDLIDFLSKKCRAYYLSPTDAGTTVEGRTEIGCNAFASGETLHTEGSIIKCWPSMLDHFNAIHSLPDYEEPVRYAEDELASADGELSN